MKRIQEINKNTPGITDEQRRKNAELMMIKFAKQMGIGDEDYCDEVDV